MKGARAFSPCSITGFFRIHDQVTDPLKVGSTGATVALELGVTTQVVLTKARTSRAHATFNGRPLPKGSVSSVVLANYLALDGGHWSIKVAHTSQLPIGCGFGTSGAGALSLSLALNEAMGLSLDRVEAAQIAHISEVVCRTGLGTVSSVVLGGLTLRTVPGAPGVGQLTKVLQSNSFRLVAASFGPIPTRRILASRLLRSRVNTCAKNLFRRFDSNSARASFMTISRRFASCLGLKTRRLERLIERMESVGFQSSMAMIGETLFCFVPKDESVVAGDFIRSQGLTPIICPIARSGAHLL